MDALEKLVDGYMEESEVDYVGLWQIVGAARRRLGARTTEEARRLSLEVVKRLYENGLRPGERTITSNICLRQSELRRCSLTAVEGSQLASIDAHRRRLHIPWRPHLPLLAFSIKWLVGLLLSCQLLRFEFCLNALHPIPHPPKERHATI